jgi:GNAT superfamily N-acetyltransferase
MPLTTAPLTPDRWDDFEVLMGPRGGAEGCWCALWRVSAKSWREGRGEGNRALMRAVVERGPPPGLLAYDEGAPVGWISVAPRADFPRLRGSRVLAEVDAAPVWSVTCFFVKAGMRGRGVASALIDAACAFAAERGAETLEGYPVDPLGGRYANGFAWTGVKSLFDAAGFAEVARRSEKRPIMRKELKP